MVDSLSASSLLSLYSSQTALTLLGAGDSGSTDMSGLILADFQAKEGIADGSGGDSATISGPTAPWNTPNGTPSESDAVQKALDGAPLIDPSSASLDAPAGTSSQDYKNLFAIYQGLNTLTDIAQNALQNTTPTTANAAGTTAASSPFGQTQLEAAFKSGLQQLQSFLGDDPFKAFNVSVGAVAEQQQSTVSISNGAKSSYTTGPLVTGDPGAASPAFQGPMQFSIQVMGKYAKAPVDVNVDLTAMGGRPRSLVNVVGFINAQLKSAGVATQFSMVNLGKVTTTSVVNGQTTTTSGDDQWGISINGLTAEAVSFSASAATPAVYVAQATGGAPQAGQVGVTTPQTTAKGDQLVKLDIGAGQSAPAASASGLPAGGVFAKSLPDGVTGVKASAMGTDGSVYMAADAAGAAGVSLLKYDASGQLIYSKALAGFSDASGLSLAVGSDGSVAVAGTEPASGSATAAAVQVFDATGAPSWRGTAPALGGSSSTSGVAFGADGSVYLSGSTTGAVGDQVVHGDSDEFIQGFKADGTATFTTQYGANGGQNTSAGLAYDAGTNALYAVGQENGRAVVRSFTLNGTKAPTGAGTRDLGVVDSVAGVAVSDGRVVVGGSVSAGAVKVGTVAKSYSGLGDGFVASLSTSLTLDAGDTVSYLGLPGGTEKATAFAVAGGVAYLAGTIANDPSSIAYANATEGFVSSVDVASGAVTDTVRLAGANGQAAPSAIAVAASGGSVLDRLGLPTGALNPAQSNLIVANTAIQAGDSFYLRTSPGGAQTKVTVTAKDTVTTLSQKITLAMAGAGTATVAPSLGGSELEIKPQSADSYIELDSRPDTVDPTTKAPADDVLAALGLKAGVIRQVKTIDNGLTDPAQLREYGLQLPASLDISSASGAQAAVNALMAAMGKVQQAYQDLATPPTLASEAAAKAGSASGAVPAYLTSELANYQAGLQRLMGGS
jgi:hypothetical protein